MLEGLVYLQKNGVYHGGVQPKNIYVKYNLTEQLPNS